MRRIGIGVVGLGRIGRLHAEVFHAKIERARLVAVCDISEELAKSIGESMGVKWYKDYDSMLKDREIDAVVICTPTFLHANMVIRALESDKDVFCEKPLTVTSTEAKEVLKKVEESKRILQVGYMRRFDPAFSQAKEKIVRGVIGKPLIFIGIARDPAPPPGWAADPKLSGGIFLDMLSHDFDMARWLIDSEVTKVYVRGGSYIYKEVKEKGDLDVVAINFEFKNGALGIIHGSRKSAFGYDLRTEVMGTEGTLYVGCSHDPLLSVGTSEGLTFYGVQWFFKRFYDAYVEEDKHFVECIIENRKPLITALDGLRAVQIAEACWRSLKNEKPEEVSLD
ncbi:MAG: inositol 2-dehydrogenase [Thermoprotei archaeon]|nr:MAG: inositol 2-dehydrogenase [Thermoprotei archaeon]